MSTPKRLRLGPLPSSSSVKMTIVCPTTLKADLDRYASLHAQAYGEVVDAEKLIVHAGGIHGWRQGFPAASQGVGRWMVKCMKLQ